MRLILLVILMATIWINVIGQRVQKQALDGTLIIKIGSAYSLDFVSNISDDYAFQLVTQTAEVTKLYQSFKGLSDELDHYLRLEFDNLAETDNLKKALTLLPFVEKVEDYPLLTVDNVPNDLKPVQWHLPIVRAPQAWLLQKGSADIVVAISDNAILIDHPDLKGVIYRNENEIKGNGIDDDRNGFVDDINGYDVADGDPDPNPQSDNFDDNQLDPGWNHGTSTSGVAGAHTNNLVGISSIGYGIQILPIKSTVNSISSRYITHGYESIVYATILGADIVSMSWGGFGTYGFANRVVEEAFAHGLVMVASAGNDDHDTPHYPAANYEVIGVGATDIQDDKSYFSNYGSWVSVMAPGEMLYTTSHGADLSVDVLNGYDFFSGTSASAPLVAGLAGLVKSFNPDMSAAELMEYIIAGCDNIDGENPTYAGQLGAGRINAEKSLILAGATLLSVSDEEHLNEFWRLFQKENKLIIEFSNSVQGKLIVTDLMGRTIQDKSVNNNRIEVKLDKNGLIVVNFQEETGQIRVAKFFVNL